MLLTSLKERVQLGKLQIYQIGRSSVWIFLCLLSPDFWVKLFPQTHL
ncbi:14966_t:CDS:2 [Rhizophagus irregularis]|nr:14966_t:CDS:2 [Rhizophagus irregularis]